jgi:DNA primase catalytic subunit
MNPFNISYSDWRPSTAKEIQSYYKHVFPTTWKSLPEYITKSLSLEYAFAFLRPIKTLERNAVKEKDFLRRANRNLESLKKLQNLLLDFKRFDPVAAVVENSQVESLYFSLKMIDERWLLAFDIDAKNVAMSGMCEHHHGLKPDADDADVIKWRRMIGGIPPVHPQHIKDPEKGYLYCFNCLQIAVNKAFELKRTLMEWGFSPDDIRIYYSGQGAHVHVIGPDAWNYLRPAREFIAKQLATNHKQPIDTMVTIDARRVLRVPGSLHGGVNRRVQELFHQYDIEEIIARPNWQYK